MSLENFISSICEQVDRSLDEFLPAADESPTTIHKAMRYSVFAGGKRLRPVLCVAAAHACAGTTSDAILPACAVELMHTYSLIHDDLPCMDNDDLRRGKPTNHKVFGEGIAVLAGDALLTESFGILSKIKESTTYKVSDYICEFALTGGSRKLIGGQTLDIEAERRKLNLNELVDIHEGKTAALLTTSIRFGAMSANASAEALAALSEFGYNLGMAFQVIDDILDETQSTEKLGKTAGKDAQAEKCTYVTLLGLDSAKREARVLTQKAHAALDFFPEENAVRLRELADYLLRRDF